MWWVKDLLAVYERSREDDTSQTAVSLTDNGWPGSIWLQQPWTNMMYTSSLAQWMPSIPPSPWWPTATGSQGPQPQSNYHLAVFILSGCKQKHSGKIIFAIILFVPRWPLLLSACSWSAWPHTPQNNLEDICQDSHKEILRKIGSRSDIKAFVTSWIQKPSWKRNWFLAMYFSLIIQFCFVYLFYKTRQHCPVFVDR